MTITPSPVLTAMPAVLLMLTLAAGCGSSAEGDASGSGQAVGSGSNVTGTATFDGVAIEPLDGLSCVAVEGDLRIAGDVGDGGWLKVQTGSASYEDGAVTWTSTSGDDRGDLEVTDAGASGMLRMYEQGTANNPGEQEFFELHVDLSC